MLDSINSTTPNSGMIGNKSVPMTSSNVLFVLLHFFFNSFNGVDEHEILSRVLISSKLRYSGTGLQTQISLLSYSKFSQGPSLSAFSYKWPGT